MDRAAWSDHLASIAAPVLRGTPLDPQSERAGDPVGDAAFIDAFTDELSHRRRVDRPILLWMLGGPRVDTRAPADRNEPDEALWWALLTGEPIEGHVHPGLGPVTGEAAFQLGAIETATETELAALHALGHHARDPKRGQGLLDRCLDAARWHVDTLQPDNGTNHPWAIHVFVWLSEVDKAYRASALMHAETLLHNAIVRTGRPDRFSACLLLDASRALRSGD